MPPTKTEPQPYRCTCGFVGSLDQVIDHVGKLQKQGTQIGHAVMLREHYARPKARE